MGWNFVRQLARHHDLWVLTETEKFQEEVLRGLAEEPEPSAAVR